MVVLFLNHIFVAQNGILMCGAGVLLKKNHSHSYDTSEERWWQ